MRWKNGLGTTTEIAIHPAGAGLDDFTWRVSIADLGASGPFSTFPGYDRVLVQLEGAPMTLSHEGREHRLRLLEPVRFAGEVETYGALEAPPARDFNVMVRRDRARAEVAMHGLERGERVQAQGAETTMIHVLRGQVSVAVDDEERMVSADEALIASLTTGLALTATESAVVILISIDPPIQHG